MSLLSKSTKNRIVATAIASSMAMVSIFGLVGCANTNTDPGNNPGGGNNNQTPDYSQYSQILQNVLTDDYYTYLITQSVISSYDNYAKNNPEYQPIPYGFLEDEGFDVSKIKNKTLSCSSELYSINNDLYVELKVEIKSSTDYFANYVLKYNLTNEEKYEIDSLFSVLYSNLGNATYFQAPFFVQELSYLKDPQVLSTAYITEYCSNNAVEYFNKKEFLATSHHAVYLGSEYVDNSQIAYHTYQIRPKTSNARFVSQIGTITTHTIGYGRLEIDNKFVQNAEMYNSGKISTQNRQNFESNIQSITSYTTRDHYFKDITLGDNLSNTL